MGVTFCFLLNSKPEDLGLDGEQPGEANYMYTNCSID
jgi:hypothetical protein